METDNMFLVKKIIASLVFIVGTLSSIACAETTNNPEYVATAERIRQHYDSNYVRLSSPAQNHYAVRMYRLTGEEYYAKQTGSEVFQITDRLNYYLENIDSKEWREERAAAKMNSLRNTRRGKLRRTALKGTGDKRFALYLVYQLAKLDEYGLKHPGHDKFVDYLKQSDLHDLLMSANFIHAYAAQVANYVYWLKYIGVSDWTGDLKAAFDKAYPNEKDDELDKNEFNNKLYGLTHIILADSHYYQNLVDPKEHQWILDYFQARQSRIVKKSKADVQAEVGLSFLLAGKNNHQTLKEMQKAINKAVHPTKNMVLSVSGKDDLRSGEHRNVLAYALLNWPQKLHPGPFLLENSKRTSSLPRVYQNK